MTRRQVLAAGGIAGAGVVLGAGWDGRLGGAGGQEALAATSCVLTPAKTEGPYFVDERLQRSDIRSDPTGTGATRTGVPLTLRIAVQRADGDCAPQAGVQVDVWHCDARGLYSDVASEGTTGQKWLRGYQVTGDDGVATFTTVYPGWYRGRAIHIHFKVRVLNGATEAYEFTSQLFFDDALSDVVMAQPAYAGRGARDTRNAQDGIYGADGAALTPALTGDVDAGYAATLTVGLSGLPATTGGGGATTTSRPLATVTRLAWTRSGLGLRVLKLTLRVDERTAIQARIARSGTTIARRRATTLAPGTRSVAIAAPRRAAAGRATLTLSLAATDGAARTVTRTVRIPARR
ncbi:MAG: intradiol ring-cleavage dioxygenase [Thermoleophilia bacterium]